MTGTKIYEVKRLDENILTEDVWQYIPEASIDIYPWDINGYKPATYAKICYTDTHMHVRFESFENTIKALYTRANDPVCRDSCVEFFLNPKPDHDNRYINFEVNAIGTMLIGLGKNRYNRISIPAHMHSLLNTASSVTMRMNGKYNGESWIIKYSIPFSFIELYFGNLDIKPGTKMLCNFYKCGDDTKYPHFGCWNKVISEQPDFHRPECFGQLIFG